MQERIMNFLNRPFPLFLKYRKGWMYYCWMIVIFVVLANILQPFGLTNWHEFHKTLVLTNYIVVFFGIYALLFLILSYLRPHHYDPDTWTVKKEFRVLLLYFPATACSTCLFATLLVPEFELSLSSFIQLQFYNSILSVVSVPIFGFFVDTKLKPTQTETPNIPASEQKEVIIKPGEIIVINKIPLVVKNICYVESQSNDLHFWMLYKEELKEVATRYTLKKLESQLKGHSQFLRCQNSFIVNMNHLKNWEIKDDKMVIHPKYCTKDISVRRDRYEPIKEKLYENFIFKAK